MTNVQRHIQYLVATSDCVIIPGWGGLIASSVPAYVDGNIFYPPSRTIVFNPSLTHDDGMLASSICRREGIAYDSAREEIAAEVSAMRNAYDACGFVALPRIGSFRRLPDSTMRFDADPTGIGPARYSAFIPVALPVAQAHERVVAPDEDIHVMPRESIARRVLRVAAFVAILLGLALTLSTPISVNLDPTPDFASVGQTQRPIQDEIYTVPAGFRFVLSVPDSARSVAPVSTKPSFLQAAEADYYLIIGSLNSKEEAEKWMDRHSDYAKGIIERHGHFRVFAATGSSIEEAFKLKSDPEFARQNPEAWVYRRR